MRKDIKIFSFNSALEVEKSFNSIYKKYIDELNLINNKYDLETDHSKNKEKQEEWNKKIDKMLNDLEVWKDTIIKLSITPISNTPQ